MPASIRLLLRGLWWRRGTTIGLLAVAVATVTAAALGPLYARAAGESTLNDHLTGASWHAGLHMTGTVDLGSAGAWQRAVAATPAAGSVHGYPQRIEGIRSNQQLTAGDQFTPKGVSTPLVWRQGECAHVVIVTGHCPTAAGEAIMSARTFAPGSIASQSLAPHPWHLGTTITVGTFDDPLNSDLGGGSTTLRIVGTYQPRDTTDPYWFGQPYFQQHLNVANGNEEPPTVDALLTSQATMLSLTGTAFLTVDVDYPLNASAVRLDTEHAERAAVAAVTRRVAHESSLRVQTALPATLNSADAERRLLDVATLLVTLQLVLLAWLVLFQVAADAIEGRGNEIAMAKLRGHSPAAVLRFGLGEPVLLLAAAIPLGVLAAWGVTHAFAAAIFAPGSPVVVTLAPVGGALAGFAGGLVAAAVAGHATLTRPVLDQWRRTERRPGHGRLVLVADTIVALAALGGLVLLLTHHNPRGHQQTLALLGPGLLVLAVALLGVRLLPALCRAIARRTRTSTRLALFLASRQVARRPVGLRLAALLAVAVGLATFAVAGESVASTNRTHRAEAEIGAERVASIQFVAGHDPVKATERADPDGHWAMAAATWLPSGGDSVAGAVLALDSSRLARVGTDVAGGPTAAALARELTGSPVPPITTTTHAVRVHLTTSDLRGSAPQVRIDFSTPSDPYYSVYSTPLRAGSSTYTATANCAATCTLRGLTWDRPIDVVGPESGTVRLTGIDFAAADGTWHPVDLRADTPHAWRAEAAEGQAGDHVTPSTSGVVDEFSNENGGYGGIVYASNPSPIPAVATASALVRQSYTPNPPQVLDSLNDIATFHVVSEPRVLPVLLTDGVLMDVRYLESELPVFQTDATWQVWLGPDAPNDAVQRLTRAGLTIDNVRTLAAREHLLGRQGPALALLLLLACAAAGAVLAAGATAASVTASGRRRTYEIAALRAIGVRRGALLRSAVTELLLVLGAGVVLGVPTGLVAARLAMPSIPEFSDSTAITLDYSPRLLPTLLFAGGTAVFVVLVALIAAPLLIRAALPTRLREAEG